MLDNKDYLDILLQIKNELAYTKQKVIMNTNKELILMYYRIGIKLKENNSWGKSFIDNLSKDLKITYPNIKGMSSRNLRYMQKFATIYENDDFLQEVLAKLTWYHNIILMDRVKKIEEKKWYAINSIENGWSSTVLIHQISTNLYKRQAITNNKITNFKNTLPSPTSELSLELIKDPYIFDFISTKKNNERNRFRKYISRKYNKIFIRIR